MTDMTDETKGDGMMIVEAIIDNLCGRSGFDAAFDVDDEILADIKEEMAGTIEGYLAAQSAMRVDNAMVVRAMKAYDEASPLPSDLCMRAALQAAIGGKE